MIFQKAKFFLAFLKMNQMLLICSCLIQLSVFAQSPGNLGTANLTAWFKAEDVAVGDLTSWTSAFPTAPAIVLTDPGLPYAQVTETPAGAISNYNMTFDFAGNSSTNTMFLNNTNAFNLLDNNFGTGTLFYSFLSPALDHNGHLFLYNEASSGTYDAIQLRLLGNTTSNIRLAIGKQPTNTSNANRNIQNDFSPKIIGYKGNRTTAASMISFLNDNVYTTASPSQSSGPRGIYIGYKPSTASSYYNGYIHEIITYDRNLTVTEITKVNTYLAIKYGITLDNTGGGTQGDYLATNDAVIWDASFTSSYHNDVIGIGRDDNQGLLQKQSHTFDDTSRLYLNSLMATNSANTGTIASDISYVLMGDNTDLVCATAASNLEIPAGQGVFSRLEREWKVQKTNFSDNMNWDVTLSNNAATSSVAVGDLRLLVDTDGDFTNAMVFSAGGGLSFTYSGGVISVTGISSAQIPDNATSYITIASASLSTPLPVDLISFTATEEDGHIAVLKWQTASEINNDYFIVERSSDLQSWEELKRVKAVGNSSDLVDYKALDDRAFLGLSYYRLKQVDFDGEFSYSQIESVYFTNELDGQFSLFPNPASTKITIKGSIAELSRITLYNEIGQDFTHEIKQLERGSDYIEFDVSNLPAGIYTVKTLTNCSKLYIEH